MSAATAPAGSEPERITDWIERHVGGRVVSIERQARWRPAWFVEVEDKDRRKPLYVRGRRDQAELLFFPLRHEAEVLRALHAAGIPGPRIYGLCEDPEAIVMDRMPGRANLATAESPAEAAQVLEEFMGVLARMHALPPALFVRAGLDVPPDPHSLIFSLFDRFEAIERAHRRRPEPEIVFVKRWLRRNAPLDRVHAAFITCDSGQFLFDAGRVTSVLDMELAHIGDPALDLASLLLRDLSEPLGDLRPAFRRYEEMTGRPVDWPLVDYYIALWAVMTPMVTGHLAKDPTPELSFLYNMDQTVMLLRVALEAVAALVGAPLDPMPPQCERQGRGGTVARQAALKGLAGALADLHPANAFDRYRHDGAVALTDYLGLLIEHEDALIAQDRAEAAALLGTDIADEEERDAALERLAAEAGPERDADLVRFFHRRVARRETLLGPKPELFVRRALQAVR